MSRANPSLRPPTPARVARVPDLPLDGFEVARAVRRGRSMWWFANRSDDPDEAGRFDLERPHGTCYLADDPVAALIERFASPDDLEPQVTYADVEATQVYVGTLARPDSVADTTDRAARLPKELGTVTPYELPWAWADALHADGRGGVRAWLRHDPAATTTIAVFGPASSRDEQPDPADWPDPGSPESARRWLPWLAVAVEVCDVPAEADVSVADEP